MKRGWALVLLAACAPTPKPPPTSTRPPDTPPQTSIHDTYRHVLDAAQKEQFKEMSPEEFNRRVALLRDFVLALNEFNKPEPELWERALDRLNDRELRDLEVTPGSERPRPKPLQEEGDRALIDLAGRGDAAARKELGERAAIILYCDKFNFPFSAQEWGLAKKALFQIGDRAKLMMAWALMSVLTSPRMADWPHARFYMAELGETGLIVLKGYLDFFCAKVPAGSIGATAGFGFHVSKLEQCFMTLLQLGPASFRYTEDGRERVFSARDHFLKLSADPRPWIRRTVAVSIVQAQDATRFDVLRRYLADADEDVRAATFDALGKASYARDEAGPLLIEALSSEKEPVGLQSISRALLKLEYRAGVPKLIGLLDHPHWPVVTHIMDALDQFTGASRKLKSPPKTPAEWKQYWEQSLKHSWK
jgi:hypothetical protein